MKNNIAKSLITTSLALTLPLLASTQAQTAHSQPPLFTFLNGAGKTLLKSVKTS